MIGLFKNSVRLLNNLKIDIPSSRLIFPEGSRQAMVCGPKECGYARIAAAISSTPALQMEGYTPDSFVACSRDFSTDEIARLFPHPKPPKNPEGRFLKISPHLLVKSKEGAYSEHDLCPAAITTVIEENRARIKQHKPIIPILFVLERIGADGLCCSLKISHTFSACLTTSELMRAYSHMRVADPLLRTVAEQTFRFVGAVESVVSCPFSPEGRKEEVKFIKKEAPWDSVQSAEWQMFETAYKIAHNRPDLFWWCQRKSPSFFSRFFSASLV